MQQLKRLEYLVDDNQALDEWKMIKMENKKRLARWVWKNCNIQIDINSLFDVQIKRIHQYKRQLLNVLYIIYRYLELKQMTAQQLRNTVPRTCMIGGKAAPGYHIAKLIIKLIISVSQVINHDYETNKYLKLIFLPNYGVSSAQLIIPATQLSQHISLAGMQASGTSNMKFIMNGSLVIGTMDGANVQIYQQVKQQNIFIFGTRVDEVQSKRLLMQNTQPEKYWGEKLTRVFDTISQGRFGNIETLNQLINTIKWRNDHYLLCNDFESYVTAQTEVDKAYKDVKKWNRMSMLNCLRSSKFSSDRTIQEYADLIWDLKSYVKNELVAQV